MLNIEKTKLPALDITGANYIQWTGYVKRHLKSMGALATIQEGNKFSEETNVKADVFLHQHIDEMLEFQYSNCDDTSILWKDLEIIFNNQREVLLPSARDEWNNLRFQDLKRLMSTPPPYSEYVKHLDFVGKLFLKEISEKNNELLMKNHQNRPIGSLALPEANTVNNNDNKNSRSKRGRGGYNGRGHGRSHGRSQTNYTYRAPQVNNINQKSNEVGTSQNAKGSCFRCGNANHWSKSCRTPSHLCELYQASHKGKEKEVNHVDQFDNTNTELIASDFFNDLEV
ncbi:T-complex protein 1 subunit epsilon [Tanacetum coccineum]